MVYTLKVLKPLAQVQMHDRSMRDVKKWDKIKVTKTQYETYMNMYGTYFESMSTEGDGITTKKIHYVRYKGDRPFFLEDADWHMEQRNKGDVIKIDNTTYVSLQSSYRKLFDLNVTKDNYKG